MLEDAYTTESGETFGIGLATAVLVPEDYEGLGIVFFEYDALDQSEDASKTIVSIDGNQYEQSVSESSGVYSLDEVYTENSVYVEMN